MDPMGGLPASLWQCLGAPKPGSPGVSPSPSHTWPLSTSSRLLREKLLLFRNEETEAQRAVTYLRTEGTVNETSFEMNFGVLHACFVIKNTQKDSSGLHIFTLLGQECESLPVHVLLWEEVTELRHEPEPGHRIHGL